MDKSLRILMIEDQPTDAELTLRQFVKAGYTVEHRRVETGPDMEKALEEADWDVVISDHNLPQFDSHQALAVLKKSGRDLPFIIVSGSIGEELAVAAMKAGANDYLMKGKLARLVPAVEREITEGRSRLERRRAEEKFRNIVESTNDIVWECDENAIITYISPKVISLTGYQPQEIVGNSLTSLIDPPEVPVLMKIFEEIRVNPRPVASQENTLVARDGHKIFMEVSAAPYFDENHQFKGLRGVNRDITPRKLAEEELRQSLKEKETLLQELYHRTKNNMQVIISMLSMQATQSTDPVIRGIMNDMKSRILSMALVHQRLYQSRNLSSILLPEYLQELVGQLLKSYRNPDCTVSLNLQAEPLNAVIEKAIPIGLIVNELVTNSMKYAFSCREEGEIMITLKKINQGGVDTELTVADNGSGYPQGFDPGSQGRLGLKIFYILCEQLGAVCEPLQLQQGAGYRLLFRMN